VPVRASAGWRVLTRQEMVALWRHRPLFCTTWGKRWETSSGAPRGAQP
jgi:hypothetical protein